MAAKALNSCDLPVENCELDLPPLQEVADVLAAGLKKNFAEVDVQVVECPDLTDWGLAASGLNGGTRLLDIGGVPYLMPTVTREKLYEMRDYPELTGIKEGLVLGAGAGPWPFLNRNCEMMPNLYVNQDKSVKQETRITRTHDTDGSYETIQLPQQESRNALLGNVFLCHGKPGPVLKVHCQKRTGPANFVTCMREILGSHYGTEKTVGMGGVFKLLQGKVKIHVMPDFSPCPITTDEQVNEWLKFYEMDSPFTVLSTFISRDPGLDLRVEHSHGWGEKNSQGGHYHYDTTPDEAEYLGYFNLAEFVYRVDKPVVTHMVGRD